MDLIGRFKECRSYVSMLFTHPYLEDSSLFYIYARMTCASEWILYSLFSILSVSTTGYMYCTWDGLSQKTISRYCPFKD